MQEQLPIHEVILTIREKLIQTNTVILQAPPGAGKSTVLPLYMLDEPWLEGKKIFMLEPRRLAARSVACRMAELLKENPGETVGYRVRFESRVSKKTRIEVLTEGILTRILQEDNSLAQAGLVIFDEFHERSLFADLALALCRETQQVLRNDLRILLMSATLDGNLFSEKLDHAPVVSSVGRQFPVSTKYIVPDESKPIFQNTVSGIRKAIKEEEGDVLAFLPGSGDIHRAASLLEETMPGFRIHCLYGDLPYEQQVKALQPDPAGLRKIVLSTSIAETSLTIEGVRIVVDSGYSRVPRFDIRSGLTRLETVRSTLDTADQRTGRAGRLGPGVCYRLWPERTTINLVNHRTPEILEADLTPLTLELLNWGIRDVNTLTWITPPPVAAISQAMQVLISLDAVEDGRITAMGKRLLEFPTHPRIAHLLVTGKSLKYSYLAASIAAILEERDPLPQESTTDISIRIELLHQFEKGQRTSANPRILDRISRLAKQWRLLLGVEKDNTEIHVEHAGRLIAAAYPERIAKREGKSSRYRLTNGRTARLSDHDPLNHEEWISIAQLDAGTKEGKIFLAAAFDPSEILNTITPVNTISWDDRIGVLNIIREWRIGNLVAAQKPDNSANPELITSALCDVIRKEGIRLFNRTEKSEQLLARINSIRIWMPIVELPVLSEERLLETVDSWAPQFVSHVRKRDDFKKIDLHSILISLLNWEQTELIDRLSPEKIKVPSGSLISLQYFQDGSPPVLAVRLQEVFGMTTTPTLNNGRVRILMHLLSPGYRPVQVTQDLESFWKNIYPIVRKELKIKYQKHSWPEDPLNAEPVRGAKKRNPK